MFACLMSSDDDIATTLRALHAPIYELQDLLHLLIPPLKAIGLLPVGSSDHDVKPLHSSINIPYHIPLIQHALIEKVAPTWESALRESGNLQLLVQYFCPIRIHEDVLAVAEVVTLAYSTILSIPLTDFSLYLLQRLSTCYSMVNIYKMIFQRFSKKQEVTWEDYVRNSLSIPTRIANSIAGGGYVPPFLENKTYLQRVCLQCEQLIAYVSTQDVNDHSIPTVVYLLSKLVGQGVFSPAPVARSQVSFFKITMSAIQRQLQGPDREIYSKLWSDLTVNMPPQVLYNLLRSMFATLQDSMGEELVLQVKIIGQTLHGIFGVPFPAHSGLWESVSGILVNEEWCEMLIHGIVCWTSGASFGGENNVEALQALLDVILSIWTSRDHVNYSFVSRHRYMTMLLLVTISYLPSTSEKVQNLILSPSFVTAIGYYISHMDESIRLCGMLVAEVLSSLAEKVLAFDVWDGEDETRLWAHRVRELIKGHANANGTNVQGANIVDYEEEITQPEPQVQDIIPVANNQILLADDGFDSDDSMTGYAPSLSPLATSSELAEVEKEPVLSFGIKRISRPLYLSQLGALLRSRDDDGQSGQSSAADNVEMALNSAEDLIRRKRDFGSELGENANNLVHALLGLQDNYDIPRFDTKRQAALNALVTSCPHLAAPCIIEEFFQPQYSIAQRFSALEALVSGARELSAVQSMYYLGKESPLSSHSHHIVSKDEKKKIRALMDEVVLNTARTKVSSNKTLPSPRTKLLQVSRFEHQSKEAPAQSSNHASFTSLSTPYFISPLVSRFWLFLRDEQRREQRSTLREGRNVHHGAGSGLILNPVTLAQFLRTLAILTHLSRLCPEWLAIVAPDALEIALTIGTLPISGVELESDIENLRGSETIDHWERKEAAALTAALELALVVLDGCLELDRGRFLSLQRAPLLRSTSDWSHTLFSRLNQGIKVSGGGGLHETALMRAVTGVLFKVDDIMTHWSQSMATLPFP